eukprot:tig00000382_g24575.t1
MDFARHARVSGVLSDTASDVSSVAGDRRSGGGTSYAVVLGAEERQKAAGPFGGQWSGLTAYQRHVKLMNDFVLFYGNSVPKADVQARCTDLDILQREHRFIRDDDEDAADASWEKRLARRYYDRLFKEFALADLSNYKAGQVGLRWRTEKEVFAGKGQFVCGNKRCDGREQLRSFEVNFAYVEANERKNALVKLRLCPECAFKLNYRKLAEMAKEEKRAAKKAEKEERRQRRKAKRARREAAGGGGGSSSGSESGESGGEGEGRRKKGGKKEKEEKEAAAAMPPPPPQQAAGAAAAAGEEKAAAAPEGEEGKAAAEVWRGPRRAAEERTAEEECDEYLASMFA